MRLPFEEDDQQLTLLPMAARRALDRAGLKLSLAGWQSLAYAEREAIAKAGAAEAVDLAEVRRRLAHASPAPTSIEAIEDPIEAPPGTESLWESWTALERYAIASYARRGKTERLAHALALLRQ